MAEIFPVGFDAFQTPSRDPHLCDHTTATGPKRHCRRRCASRLRNRGRFASLKLCSVPSGCIAEEGLPWSGCPTKCGAFSWNCLRPRSGHRVPRLPGQHSDRNGAWHSARNALRVGRGRERDRDDLLSSEPALHHCGRDSELGMTPTGFAEESVRIVSVSCHCDPPLGASALLIPLLIPLLRSCCPHSAADASGQPGRVLCRPRRRIS